MEKGETDELFNNPLHPYTKALFSAVPVPDPDVKNERIILEGDIPSPANPPRGCKFHTRCSQCMSACKIIEPKYHEVTPGHFVACHLYDEDILSRRDELDEAYRHVKEMEEREAEIKDEYDVLKAIKDKFAQLKNKSAKEDSKVAKDAEIKENEDEYVGFDSVQNQEITHVLEDENEQNANDSENEK